MDEHEHAPSPVSGEDTPEHTPAGTGLRVDPSGHSELSALQAELGVRPPPPPQPQAEDTWSFGGGARTSRLAAVKLPPVKRPVALLVGVALVAAAGAYLMLNRKSSAGGTALALSLTRNASYGYDVHMEMGGTISAEGRQIPFNMQADQNVGWRVTDMDADGTATVTVSTKTASARVNGQLAPALPTQTMTIRVARDGRILSGGVQISGFDNSDLGSLVPGSNQFLPLLPDHPVKPGDSWTKKFDQDLPFGMGRLQYSVDSTFLRYETVGGKRMAVLLSTIRLPLDMSIDLRKVLGASGQSAGNLIPGGSNPKMQFGGSMTMDQTAWFDEAHGELYKSSGNARFDMSIEFKDFPARAGAPSGPMQFSGTMSLQVLRGAPGPGGSKPSRKRPGDAQAKRDLRNAMAAAIQYYADHASFRGITPAALASLDRHVVFNVYAKARKGQVSIRVAGDRIVLVTRSASGSIFCFGHDVATDSMTTPTDRFGRNDARSYAGCRGGW